MHGQWQPYPNHPQVQEVTGHLADLRERALQALIAGDSLSARRLLDERQAVQERLEEITAALLRDESLVPRWIRHTDADAVNGAVACLECGNNVPAGESRCSYCGWTYFVESSTGA
jgi:hypothetical protein